MSTLEPVIFLHLPKTAGTTLSTTLRWLYGPEAVYFFDWRRLEDDIATFVRLPRLRQEQVRLLMGHVFFGLHAQCPGSWRYITMFRDPVRRVFSTYHYVRTHWPESSVASMTLTEYLNSGHPSYVPNDQARRVSGLLPGEEEASGRVLDIAKSNLERHFAAFGIVERFDESLLLMKNRLGWNRFPYYVSSNVNRKRPAVKALSEQEQALIEEQNALDLALYAHVREQFQREIDREGPGFQEELRNFRSRNRLCQYVAPGALWTFRSARKVARRLTGK